MTALGWNEDLQNEGTNYVSSPESEGLLAEGLGPDEIDSIIDQADSPFAGQQSAGGCDDTQEMDPPIGGALDNDDDPDSLAGEPVDDDELDDEDTDGEA